MLGKMADTFQAQVKVIGSIETVSSCSAYKMCDCSRILQLGFSCTDVEYPIAKGVTEPSQTLAVVKWVLENICHLLRES